MTDLSALPEGIFSLLDTDLYKLTMQSAILKYFADVPVSYTFSNRTPDMKLNRLAFRWLQRQIDKLSNISLTEEELAFLRKDCTYLSESYLQYLRSFKFRPHEHVKAKFVPEVDTGQDEDLGELQINVEGLWIDTILYEIPLLALTSEAYFKFMDTDWTHDGQVEKARDKGRRLIEGGCVVSEFGTRRRRDLHTLDLVIQGLTLANQDMEGKGHSGKIVGTSNVYMAMKYGLAPTGTIAHEWFMGIAAMTNDYFTATEIALSHWVGTFGKGVLGVALTDTFGTPQFLKEFVKPLRAFVRGGSGSWVAAPSFAPPSNKEVAYSQPSTSLAAGETGHVNDPSADTYAEVFTGVRQDSGDPLEFVKVMEEFYKKHPPKSKKAITFSDSLNVEKAIKYKEAAEDAGFMARFGIGTFFTNDFKKASSGDKSSPMNIVIKLSSADGKPAIKISDNLGKNTGDKVTVQEVKAKLGYQEHEWREGDEQQRWN